MYEYILSCNALLPDDGKSSGTRVYQKGTSSLLPVSCEAASTWLVDVSKCRARSLALSRRGGSR